MKTWFQILIFILYTVAIFFSGYSFKDCPPATIIRPHSTIIIDGPKIDSLQNASQIWHENAVKYQKQRDSVQKLLNKKNETVIIYSDTCIPAILREWASYQVNE